jgi:hypothetical protein
MNVETYLKALNIILSCKTPEHISVTRKYLKLLYEGKASLPNIMLETQFLIKLKEIENT